MSSDDRASEHPEPAFRTAADVTLRLTGSIATGAAKSTAALVVIAGNELGRKYPLRDARSVIGRSSGADIQLEEEAVSRSHAEILPSENSFVLRDLGSTNGTFVNDRKLAQPHLLAEGDRVRIGPTTFKFLAAGSSEAAYHEEIYRRRTRDALTGAFNRAYFQEQLERAWRQPSRGSLGLLLLDVDHFKQVNDTHGHAAGDAVLRELPARIGPLLGAGEMLARYGGEEFALLAAGIDADKLRGLAERIRQAIAARPIIAGGIEIRVTASIGLALAAANAATPAALVQAADEQLYAAKRAGRNRVHG